MNVIINEFLSAGDKFILEMDLRHAGNAYSGCEPITKNKEKIKKKKERNRWFKIYLSTRIRSSLFSTWCGL